MSSTGFESVILKNGAAAILRLQPHGYQDQITSFLISLHWKLS